MNDQLLQPYRTLHTGPTSVSSHPDQQSCNVVSQLGTGIKAEVIISRQTAGVITVQRPALQTNWADFATDEAKGQQDHCEPLKLVYFPPRGICTHKCQLLESFLLPLATAGQHLSHPWTLLLQKCNNPDSSACHPPTHCHGSHGSKANWDSAASQLQDTSLVPIPTTTTVPMLRGKPSSFAPLTWYQSLAFTAVQMQGCEEICRHQWMHWQPRYPVTVCRPQSGSVFCN